ncbi:hypothetical protein BJY59DRAFT_368178 [Rhodotorula toruloides]
MDVTVALVQHLQTVQQARRSESRTTTAPNLLARLSRSFPSLAVALSSCKGCDSSLHVHRATLLAHPSRRGQGPRLPPTRQLALDGQSLQQTARTTSKARALRARPSSFSTSRPCPSARTAACSTTPGMDLPFPREVDPLFVQRSPRSRSRPGGWLGTVRGNTDEAGQEDQG